MFTVVSDRSVSTPAAVPRAFRGTILSCRVNSSVRLTFVPSRPSVVVSVSLMDLIAAAWASVSCEDGVRRILLLRP